MLLVLEVATLVLNALKIFKGADMPPELRILRGVFVYTLYYTTCIYGPLDLAKAVMLRKGLKLSCYFVALMIAFQNMVAAMFFDNLIFMMVPS
jgi:hypothetical protein